MAIIFFIFLIEYEEDFLMNKFSCFTRVKFIQAIGIRQAYCNY